MDSITTPAVRTLRIEQRMDAEPFGVAGRGFEKQDRADRVSVAPGAFIRVARGG
jgi:hypothetical protein